MSAPLISSFTTGAYEVKRSGAGFYKNGVYRKGEIEEIKMNGSLQPISGNEIKQSTDGERLKYDFKFYSFEPLVTIGTGELSQADEIEINGTSFRVVSVQEWENSIGFGGVDLPHFKTMLLRNPQQ